MWTLPIGDRPATRDARDRIASTASSATWRSRARRKSRGRAPTARPSRACCSTRSTIRRGAATRSSCRCTADRSSPTSSAPDRRSSRTICRCSPAKATRCSGRTIAAAPATAAAFFRDVVNGYFHNMASDIMTGVDHLVQAGIADPDRLIAMGWSAGGTLVNKLVTMTDRFKVASAGAGVVELDVALRPDRRHHVPHHLVRRDAVAQERADRSLLEQLAAEGRREREDADAVLRRRRRYARAGRAVDGNVPRAPEQRRADAPLRRAARRAINGASCGISSSRRTPSSNGSRSTRWAGPTSGRRHLSRSAAVERERPAF